ncbi:putative glucan 1,3-beta-glucosidase [Naematelia encephala]|uniref:Putative glucan 1,3-beta-glucosidase n=1 Tax=Naematelia encephala TaxID=71784 RepID=A0A1Y2AYZ4_9TREE|nr:putative glucan 1,3-beta-glucosidase [Naematelia encephala]
MNAKRLCCALIFGLSGLVADSPTASRATSAPGFTWGGTEKMRGVNIGGWLVLEPWITPSLFASKPPWVVDEWTYGQYMASKTEPLAEIRNHWNTWLSFVELENIAAVGLNTIRIPIGFWSVIPLLSDEPYLVGAYDFLKLAVTWAQSLNLKVMVDLHGAPGSQNGFDNSGLRGTREWFVNTSNVARTTSALQVLTAEFTRPQYNGTVLTVELINEPFPYTPDELDFLKSYYQKAYSTVNAASEQSTIVVAIDQAFQGLSIWQDFMTEPSFHNVAQDTHIYSMFDLTLIQMGYDENLQWYCSQYDSLEQSNQAHWTIVGEFTPAHTDCAMWLNGRGTGARYDNTLHGTAALAFPGDCRAKSSGDPTQFSADYIDHLGASFETQTWIYELAASGWIQWTWKTEEAADWSLSAGITYGWIPTPITAKPHGTPCNFSSLQASGEPSNFAPDYYWWMTILLVLLHACA